MKNRFNKAKQATLPWLKRKRTWVIVGIIVLLLIILTSARSGQDQANIERIFMVDTTDIMQAVQITGVVEPAKRASLGFESTGRLSELLVSDGQFVEAGQVLAVLDARDVLADQAQARAEVNQQQAKLAQTTRGASQDELVVAQNQISIAQAQLNQTTQTLQDTTREQQTLVDNAYQALLTNDLQAYPKDDGTQTSKKPTISGSYQGTQQGVYIIDVYASSGGFSFRLSGLESDTQAAAADVLAPLGRQGLQIQFINGSQSGDEWLVPVPNTASTSYQSALSAYEAAQELKVSAIAAAEQAVLVAQANLAEAEARLLDISNPDTQNIAVDQAILDGAKARLARSQALLSDTQIIAPFSGTVGKINYEKGETIQAGVTVIEILTTDNYLVSADLPEIDVATVNLEQEASVTFDALPGKKLDATVVLIDPIETLVDGVPVYKTELQLKNIDPFLRSGMTSNITIVTDTATSVLGVPVRYIFTEDDQDYVLIQNNPQEPPVQTLVSIGLRGSNGIYEITDGVAKNDRLIQEESSDD